MNDFEKQFSDRFNDAVDAKTGRRVPPPEFIPAQGSRGRHTRRWLAIAAALVIVALGAGGALATGVLRGTAPGIAATPSPVPSASGAATETSSPSAAQTDGSPTAAASDTSSSATAAVAGTYFVLDGAQIFVPNGWAVSPASVGGETVIPGKALWCLGLAGETECIIGITQVSDGDSSEYYYPINPDIPGGFVGVESSGCEDGNALEKTAPTKADVRNFGGIAAEHRVWNVGCTTEKFYIEQYVVPTFPSYVANVTLIDPTPAEITQASQVLAAVAANSALPEALGSVRLSDTGVVTAVSKPNAAGEFTVTLDRIFKDVEFDQAILDPDHATYTYTLTSDTLCKPDASHCQDPPLVGDQVTVYADAPGSKIVSFTRV